MEPARSPFLCGPDSPVDVVAVVAVAHETFPTELGTVAPVHRGASLSDSGEVIAGYLGSQNVSDQLSLAVRPPVAPAPPPRLQRTQRAQPHHRPACC